MYYIYIYKNGCNFWPVDAIIGSELKLNVYIFLHISVVSFKIDCGDAEKQNYKNCVLDAKVRLFFFCAYICFDMLFNDTPHRT